MESTEFYPQLSTILQLEAIPEELSFIQTGLSNLFEKILVKEDQVVNNHELNSRSSHLVLLSYKRLDLEIPGTGLILILNPDFDANTESYSTTLPISVILNKGILGLLDTSSISSFSQSPFDYFLFLIDHLGFDEEEIIYSLISAIIPDQSISTFVSDINTRYSLSPALNYTATDNLLNDIEQVNELILTHPYFIENEISSINVIWNTYFENATNDDERKKRLTSVFKDHFSGDVFDSILDLFIPKLEVKLSNLSVGLEFPRTIFQPIATATYNTTPPLAIGEALPEPFTTLLKFTAGSINFTTNNGIQFIGENSFDFPKSYILGTKFSLEIHDLKLDLSRKTNIPEAIADGRPDDFMGVYIKEGVIGFPADWNHDGTASTGELYVNNFLAGTGGLSGTIGLRAKTAGATSALIKATFGSSFQAELDTFSLTFQQNAITASDIGGKLTLLKVKDDADLPLVIDVKIHIESDGDFSITASKKTGKLLKFGQAFQFNAKELEVGKQDGKFYLSTTGDLIFPETSPVYKILELKEPIPINKLKIWEDGHIEVDGGSIHLPKAITANLGTAKISITAIHMGSYEKGGRKYKYFGFDGGVNVNPGGVDVRGTGLKFYYTVDGGSFDSFISIDSIAIDLIIPGTATKETASVLIQGWLSVQGDEYMGGVVLQLPKLNMAGNVDMRFDTKYPAWIVDAGFEFPSPIPLAATGLGIYGFRGLVGQRYVASKTAAGLTERDTWFDYYKAKTPLHQTQGINVEKFDKPEGTKTAKSPFSVGAGATIATLAKDGDVFSTKLFLLLSLPSVVYLEGKATILDKRLGLNDNDPPFFAVVAFEPHKSVVFNLGTQYQIGDQGRILDMYAEIGAGYYFDNPAAWYINFGTKDKPMQAKVLSLFQERMAA